MSINKGASDMPNSSLSGEPILNERNPAELLQSVQSILEMSHEALQVIVGNAAIKVIKISCEEMGESLDYICSDSLLFLLDSETHAQLAVEMKDVHETLSNKRILLETLLSRDDEYGDGRRELDDLRYWENETAMPMERIQSINTSDQEQIILTPQSPMVQVTAADNTNDQEKIIRAGPLLKRMKSILRRNVKRSTSSIQHLVCSLSPKEGHVPKYDHESLNSSIAELKMDNLLPDEYGSIDSMPSTTFQQTARKQFEMELDESVLPIVEMIETKLMRIGLNDGRKMIKGLSLEQIVEQITWIKRNPYYPMLMDDFMITLHGFTTPPHLFTLLLQRFHWNPQELNLTGESATLFDSQILSRVRYKVFIVLKVWIELHPHDWIETEDMHRQLVTFIDGDLSEWDLKHSRLLKRFFRKKIDELNSNESAVQNIINDDCDKDGSMFEQDKVSIRALGVDTGMGGIFDPLRVAQQIFLLDYSMFKAIPLRQFIECTNDAMGRKEAKSKLPFELCRMIQHSNRMILFVISLILRDNLSMNERAAMIKFFIKVATYSLQLNNYNGVRSIGGALESAAIHRLDHTWSNLSKHDSELWNNLCEQILDPTNQSCKLRNAQNAATLPCIPWIGAHLHDLIYIGEAHPTVLDYDKSKKEQAAVNEQPIYNMTRCRMMGIILRRLYQCQDKFNKEIKKCLPIQRWLMTKGLNGLNLIEDEYEQWEISLHLEPRHQDGK